jgi:hypothetical protein
MFEGVDKKLERATYCLQNLRTLASDAEGFAHIPREKQQAMRANLDCFFFEIISAKDFFLQGIYDACSVTSLKRHQVNESKLIAHLPDGKAKQVVTKICDLLDDSNLRPEQKLQDDKYSWLWRLNNYRNSATHRELLHMGYVAGTTLGRVEVHLFKDPEDSEQGNIDTEVIPYCEQSLEKMTRFLRELYSQLGI